jgi:uncharacterized membrane protein YeiH
VIRRIGLARLVLVADLGGTFLFALEGATIACRAGLDLLGVVVIGFVAALGGGIVRDVLLGAVPPAAVKDSTYPMVTLAGSAVALAVVGAGGAVPAEVVTVLDAAGLALFAVTGVQKALVRGIGPFGVVLMGTVTAVGGGMVRDVLLAQVPVVLRADFYATAAVLGGAAILLVRRAGLSLQVASGVGGAVCFGTRMAAVAWGWHLPLVG